MKTISELEALSDDELRVMLAKICGVKPVRMWAVWYDNTRLVLLAHCYFVRVEIASSGPRMVKIIAHRRAPRTPDDMQHERHPSLDDLISEIRSMQP